MKDVIFHCGRFPHLVLTVSPFGLKDPVGNQKPARHLHFKSDPELGAGIMRLTNEDHAKFVRNHEYFKNGKIIEVSDASDLPAPKVEDKVSTGVHNSNDVRVPSGAPKGGDLPVKAAKVPGKRGK